MQVQAGSRQHGHAILLLRPLHRLCVHFWVQFKALVIPFKALNGIEPKELKTMPPLPHMKKALALLKGTFTLHCQCKVG